MEGKVPRRLRAMVPIIADAEGILWVGGLRRAERGRVGEEQEEGAQDPDRGFGTVGHQAWRGGF